MPTYRASEPVERPDHVEPGDYTVEVIDAVETVSKNGHDMIELKLRTDRGSLLYDFLVFLPSAFWKIDAFRAATGETITPDEDVDITADDLIGRTGKARLIVETYQDRRRNKVAAWLHEAAASPGPRAAATPPAHPGDPF